MRMSNYDIKNIYEWPLFIRISFFCLVSILIFYIGFLLDINNLREYIKGSQQQQGELLNQFNDMINKKIMVKNDISQLPELQQLLNKWEKEMVTGVEIPGILDEIIKTASEDHLQLNLLDPQNEVKDKLYYKIPVKIQMSGTFDQVSGFLSQVANMSKVVVIGDFTMTKENESTLPTAENKMVKSNNVDRIELTLDLYKK